MEIYRDIARFPATIHPVVALGSFDGVHCGHQEVLRAAIARARALAGQAFALTFDPLPAKVLAPEHAPRLLMTSEDRLEFLARTGLDGVLLVPFTRDLSQVSARAFLSEILHGRLGAKAVVAGHSITFGHQAQGNAALMAEVGREVGFETVVVGPVMVDGVEVSSTRIRVLIEAGELPAAARLLSRYHFLRGEVVHGRERGRQIGFPTANLAARTECLPPDGVYATRVITADGAWPSITNIGLRPTFQEQARSIESHIFDFNRDLYDQTIALELIERIRPERKFESGEALSRQIALDVARAREIVAQATAGGIQQTAR